MNKFRPALTLMQECYVSIKEVHLVNNAFPESFAGITKPGVIEIE